MNREMQTVVAQTEGQPPTRLTKCAVVDNGNWRCNVGTSNGVQGFTDGKYCDGYELIEGGMVNPYVYSQMKAVSRWDWLDADEPKK